MKKFSENLNLLSWVKEKYLWETGTGRLIFVIFLYHIWRPLHIFLATLAHLPANLCTSPRQPKATPKLLSNSWDEGIWVKG